MLTASGYDVVTAGSRAAAMKAVEQVSGAIDALILDIGLPDADGADVARDIADRIGQRPTLYVSGWSEDFWQLSEAPGRWRVRQKPIPIPWLLDTVRWLAEGGEARRRSAALAAAPLGALPHSLRRSFETTGISKQRFEIKK